MAKCVRWLQEQVVALLLTCSVLQPWVAQRPCRLSGSYSQKAHLVTSAFVSIGFGGWGDKKKIHEKMLFLGVLSSSAMLWDASSRDSMIVFNHISETCNFN